MTVSLGRDAPAAPIADMSFRIYGLIMRLKRMAFSILVVVSMLCVFAGGWCAHRYHQRQYDRLNRALKSHVAAIGLSLPPSRLPATARAIKVVMLGDSITDMQRDEPWWDEFSDKNGIANLAISRSKSTTILREIRDGVLDGLRPKAIIVMVGVNDLINGDASVPDTVAVIAQTVDEAHRRCPVAKVIVLSPLPRWADGESQADVGDLSSALRQALPREFVDVAHPFIGKPTLFRDGLHPSAEGFLLLKSEIESLLLAP